MPNHRPLHWLTLVLLTTLLSACPTAPPSTLPAEFELEWALGPAHADRGPQRFLRVSAGADGAYRLTEGERFRFISKQDGKLREQTTALGEHPLAAAEVLGLYQLLLREDVPDMPPLSRNPDILDGDVQRLTIHWQDFDKTITAVNTRPKALSAVRERLEALRNASR